MVRSTIINVFDLGPGDGGKGGVVHKYATEYDAHTILKVGGAQGSHGVTTNDGRSFAFSQWGCGTFEDIQTHITDRFVVSPDGLVAEAKALQDIGISDPWDLITIDGGAICSTPYHGFSSRIKELLRGNNPRGTIGSGVGQAYRRSISCPSLTFRAHEFSNGDKTKIAAKLEDVRRNELELLQEFGCKNLLESDVNEYNSELNMFNDDGFFDYIVDVYESLFHILPVVNEVSHIRSILNVPGVMVVENSHGILTDNIVGFNPHTSALRTLPKFNYDYFNFHNFSGKYVNIGVHRAYSIRHGAGPLPTNDPSMNDKLLPGSNKDENRYQGKVRVGPLDFVLLKYALAHSEKVDALAITWFDQISKNGSWNICNSYYSCYPNFTMFDSICPEVSDLTYNYSNLRMTKALINILPTIETIKLPESIIEQFDLCCNIMQTKLNVPVDLVSFGPMSRDKRLRGIINV